MPTRDAIDSATRLGRLAYMSFAFIHPVVGAAKQLRAVWPIALPAWRRTATS